MRAIPRSIFLSNASAQDFLVRKTFNEQAATAARSAAAVSTTPTAASR
jgi:hypothetical protein